MSVAPGFCCAMRKKVMAAPVVIPEADCGVSDSVLADFVRFDLPNTPTDPNGRPMPVIKWAFCAWCGHRLSDMEPVRVLPQGAVGPACPVVVHEAAQIMVTTAPENRALPVGITIRDLDKSGQPQGTAHLLPMSCMATSNLVAMLGHALGSLAVYRQHGEGEA